MSDQIRISNLTKFYGKKKVLSDFSLVLEKRHICGLIGPNGAGKTTILRILAGITGEYTGRIALLGSEDKLDISRKRMAFSIEEPIIDKDMSAAQNMEYVRIIRGIPDNSKIPALLKQVGLEDTGKMRVGKFSLGMRQRLSIAMMMLADPEVLVLDEPMNGLDPQGMAEIRTLLPKLVREKGVSILISSHLLSELSEICTDYSIIRNGRLVENISAEELNAKCSGRICLRTDNNDRTCAILEKELGIRAYKVLYNGEIHILEQLDKSETIIRTLIEKGVVPLKIMEEHSSLEEYYLEKVGGSNE